MTEPTESNALPVGLPPEVVRALEAKAKATGETKRQLLKEVLGKYIKDEAASKTETINPVQERIMEYAVKSNNPMTEFWRDARLLSPAGER